MTNRVCKRGKANGHVGHSNGGLVPGSVGYHHADFRDEQHSIEYGQHYDPPPKVG